MGAGSHAAGEPGYMAATQSLSMRLAGSACRGEQQQQRSRPATAVPSARADRGSGVLAA